MTGIKILGTGRFAPEKIVSNGDFASIIETTDEWIFTRTGMKERHIAGNAEPTWHMGKMAAESAIMAAGIGADEIDMIILVTVTPDFSTPSCACVIQREIGAANAFSMDVNVACSGFSFAFDMARRYLSSGNVKTVLLIGAESLTQLVDYGDRTTCVLFGDGAGACVVTASNGRFGSYLKTDITGTHCIYAKRPRSANPFIKDESEPREPFELKCEGSVHMDGRDVYKFATKAMPQAIRTACERAGIKPDDLTLVIPHQANARIIETAAKNLDLPMDKVYINIQKYGNTSGASIPMALDECVRDARFKRGDFICVVGFGAGLTYGASVFEY